MITAYHRPESIDEALDLILRSNPRTVPLGGGTFLSHIRGASIEVVDLQALGLDRVEVRGKKLMVGATATLQQLLGDQNVSDALRKALRLEAPLNVRNLATVAGTLVVCDGRSSLATCLLALDCSLNLAGIEPATQTIGEFLPLRQTRNAPYLIQRLEMPLNPHLAFEYVARTPADKPIVAVAAARWPSGRIRVAVGGFGPSPVLAMDGKEAGGIEPAAKNAMHDASDPWGSAEYRMDVAATLARRCLASLDA